MRFLLLAAGLAAVASSQAPPPDAALEAARAAALHYSQTLPDFLCTEHIRRYDDWNGQEFRVDTLTLQVGYYKQQETYRLLARDNHATGQRIESLNGSFSRGEFGSALRFIFDPESDAVFEPRPAARIRRRPVAVYAYAVAYSRSHYKLASGVAETTTAYHGLVYIDSASHRTLRLTMETDPPESFPIREVATTIDYDFRAIGGSQYLLPVRAEVRILERVTVRSLPRFLRYRNLVEFRDYRKFSTESRLTFEP